MIMKNGLHNPLGYCTCIGLNFLPLWMFVIQNMPTSVFASLTLGYFLLVFRLLAGMTELWFIFTHIQTMLKYDVTMQNKEMIFL